jgi:hypothetical protein
MPVYDKRYEDQPIGEYVNIVLKLISPYSEKGVRMTPPRFGRMELKNEQLGYLPVYLDYDEAVKDYPDDIIHQVRINTNG